MQRLCDEWLRTAIAKELAVTRLHVTEDCLLSPEFKFTHEVQDHEEVLFPVDSLLFFIVDRAIEPASIREKVKAAITAARERAPDVYRKFKVNLGPKRSLFLTCKNPACRNLMMTQFMAYGCESSVWGPSEVQCSRCKQVYEYDQNDLHFVEGY